MVVKTVAGIPMPLSSPFLKPFGKMLIAMQNPTIPVTNTIVQETSMNEPAERPGIPLPPVSVLPFLSFKSMYFGLTLRLCGGGYNCPTKRGRRPHKPMVRWAAVFIFHARVLGNGIRASRSIKTPKANPKQSQIRVLKTKVPGLIAPLSAEGCGNARMTKSKRLGAKTINIRLIAIRGNSRYISRSLGATIKIATAQK